MSVILRYSTLSFPFTNRAFFGAGSSSSPSSPPCSSSSPSQFFSSSSSSSSVSSSTLLLFKTLGFTDMDLPKSLPGSPFLLLARYWSARIGAPNLEVMAECADDGVLLALLLQARNLLDLAPLAGCLFILIVLVVPTVAPIIAIIGISGLGETWSPSLSPGESPPPLFDGTWTLHSGKALGDSGLPPPPLPSFVILLPLLPTSWCSWPARWPPGAASLLLKETALVEVEHTGAPFS
ncbi:hypothetical protein F5876DRAFT_83768 [Lentinula aff. lateritia]|uniref:Uncharacterized protein n=1 Tax=Lentinula aff. lateritia TaxID=2804960 RepID=A0ACC1THM6_9AGAR|nr:hypothetical protein F5876DRAFT_83768 [Lentinula aff. lateritia]